MLFPRWRRGCRRPSCPQPAYTKLGGETKAFSRAAVLVGEIDGKTFHTEAMVIDSIGADDDDKPIEILLAPGDAAVGNPARAGNRGH